MDRNSSATFLLFILETEITGFTEVKDYIVVYIDSARFLPHNIAGTRIVARIVNPNMKTIDGIVTRTDIILETLVYFPVYQVCY
jgi:hypothetical protein